MQVKKNIENYKKLSEKVQIMYKTKVKIKTENIQVQTINTFHYTVTANINKTKIYFWQPLLLYAIKFNKAKEVVVILFSANTPLFYINVVYYMYAYCQSQKTSSEQNVCLKAMFVYIFFRPWQQ